MFDSYRDSQKRNNRNSMQIQENLSVQSLHTFGVEAHTRYLLPIISIKILIQFLNNNTFKNTPYLILGSGSNLLFTKDFEGIILKNEIKGIEIIHENKDKVTVKVGGGEVWHSFVLWCIAQDFGGIENLSLIPGTIGAAPIQNIGAYGIELKDVMTELEAFHIKTQTVETFTNAACQFGYRNSIFKQQYKGQYFITSVTFELTKQHHQLNTKYGAIQTILAQKSIKKPTIKDISNAVIEIRSSKLPDPAVLGNSGSFFKNPIVSTAFFEKLYQQFPKMPYYTMPKEKVKIPAGWLIEQCGWKGKRVGNTGAYAKQALVLVNYGGAKGKEIKTLAEAIQVSVKEKFGIDIFPEVNLV